ncbi:MAG TPA: methylenetetrahydrofolate reductase [candidate division Zixibacteria bacterium]|nr:methylenetetrahydrofolate reductase [candidate division Zixibacteria bacterium]
MYVTEHLERARNPLFSYEIIPPPRGKSAREILDIVERLMPFEPPFIDVTAHSAAASYDTNPDGTVVRKIRRKRPGTLSICGIIQNRYNIDTVPHLLCQGFTREETEDAMIELNFLGIHNVLAIRGDEPNFKVDIQAGRTVNEHSLELVEQLDHLRDGYYLDELEESEAIDLCIGVGGYPEKHFEAPNLSSDIAYLKEKVDAGADYIVTQMFFDNMHFIDFADRCRRAGIDVPIIPGIKVINSTRQLTLLPKRFHIDLPDRLVDAVNDEPKRVRQIGIDWAVQQCEQLLNYDAKCIHFFVFNDVKSVEKVVTRLRK